MKTEYTIRYPSPKGTLSEITKADLDVVDKYGIPESDTQDWIAKKDYRKLLTPEDFDIFQRFAIRAKYRSTLNY